MADDDRDLVRRVLGAMLDAVSPEALAERAVTAFLAGRDRSERDFDLLAVGKAADGSCRGALRALGDRLAEGLVVGPHTDTPVAVPPIDDRRIERLAGDHPIPGAASFAAGHRALTWLRERASVGRPLLFLISGGGSAMLEASRDPQLLPPDRIAELHRALIGAGLPIADVNRVRAMVSAVKAGGLARAAGPRVAAVFVLSDVPPGAIRDVASGPASAVEHDEDFDAFRDRAGLDDRLPPSVLELVERASRVPQPSLPNGDGRLPEPELLADADTALTAGQRGLQAQGLAVWRGDRQLADGPVEPIARAHVDALRRFAGELRSGMPGVLLSAGEADVALDGECGRGGRNQELALRVARAFECSAASMPGRDAFVFASCGSDGIDGNTTAAGAVVDATTLDAVRAAGLDVDEILARHDAHRALRAAGHLLETGPTGTNVRDLRVGVVRGR